MTIFSRLDVCRFAQSVPPQLALKAIGAIGVAAFACAVVSDIRDESRHTQQVIDNTACFSFDGGQTVRFDLTLPPKDGWSFPPRKAGLPSRKATGAIDMKIATVEVFSTLGEEGRARGGKGVFNHQDTVRILGVFAAPSSGLAINQPKAFLILDVVDGRGMHDQTAGAETDADISAAADLCYNRGLISPRLLATSPSPTPPPTVR